MSIATEDHQNQMLAIGQQLFDLTGDFATGQGALDIDARTSATAQIMMQAGLGHCEASERNLSLFVYGAAYAIGSLMSQISDESSRYVFSALQAGLIEGGKDARRDFNSGGRA